MKCNQASSICGKKSAKDTKILKLSYDSRDVTENTLFFAIRGHKVDGNIFVPELLGKFKNICIMSEEEHKDERCIMVDDVRECMGRVASAFYNHPSRTMKVTGITGTNGKTTTTYLLKSIFSPNAEIIGTTGYTIKGERVTLSHTTPESVDLHRILKNMLENRAKYCFMEVSAHAITLKRTAGISFALKVLTNISQDHLDYYKTMENYASAKLSFFTPDDKKVLNADDKYASKLIDKNTVSYGFSEEADVHPEEYQFTLRGIEATIKSPIGTLRIQSPLIGQYNLYNIMCAVASAISLGCHDRETIIRGIKECKNVPGRLEFFLRNGRYAVVDYAHTDDAMANVLRALNDIKENRLIVVFGAGGDRDRGKRPKMGKVAEEMADIAVVTSDNPRSEDPVAIIRDILNGMDSPERAIVEPDREKAIKMALDMAEKGDIVAVLGKGHEDYQIIKSKKIHFDDREVIRKHWQL